MLLQSFTYAEHVGQPREWRLEDLTLTNFNLLVGKNATGKSRTLNVISALARVISRQTKESLISGDFEVIFTADPPASLARYLLNHDNGQVSLEEYFLDNVRLLHRGAGGIGKIFAKEVNQEMKCQVPNRELAVVTKRDAFQHEFLEPLHAWADSLRHFEFGKGLGHFNLAFAVKGVQQELNDKDTNQVIPIFAAGLKIHGDEFKNAIKIDMSSLGYEIDDLLLERPSAIQLTGLAPGDLISISVKERTLQCTTDQPSISQGMFRALSVIIQVTYAIMSKRATTILIDDIGEGLDYERSCSLLRILREKVRATPVQLILTTNDRFIMNAVPLEEWTLLRRRGCVVKAINYRNSKPVFDRFKITGLNNFDFLATDFADKAGSDAQIRDCAKIN
jgi:hypothetical protein